MGALMGNGMHLVVAHFVGSTGYLSLFQAITLRRGLSFDDFPPRLRYFCIDSTFTSILTSIGSRQQIDRHSRLVQT
jgi:hypothetical protein